MRALLLLMTGVFAASTIAGCDFDDCAGIGIVELRPSGDVTLPVGGSFTGQMLEGGRCGPTHPIEGLHVVESLWFTVDSAIVHVDSLTGRVQALSVGDARVWARPPGQGWPANTGLLSILVHVR